jgi:hypothetical protein
VIEQKRHAYLLPQERYLINRFFKGQAESPKLQARGPKSATLYLAASANALPGRIFVASGLGSGGRAARAR